MKEFMNQVTFSTGGGMMVGAFSGEFIIALIGLICMIAFGSFGAWLKYRDSKALREALEAGDIKTALKLRGK